MKRFSYLMLLMLISSSIFSQNDAIKINQIETIDGSSKLKSLECGTPEPTAAQYAFTRDSLSRIKFNRNSGTTAIPIRAVIVRTNSGTGGISLENLNIGLATDGDNCTNNPTVIANANLVAAAPDLLEALEDMVAAYESLDGAQTSNGSWHSCAVLAIAKAKAKGLSHE